MFKYVLIERITQMKLSKEFRSSKNYDEGYFNKNLQVAKSQTANRTAFRPKMIKNWYNKNRTWIFKKKQCTTATCTDNFDSAVQTKTGSTAFF